MNRIWLIGASEGIGRAIAGELAKEQENFLILSARNEKRLKELAEEIPRNNLLVPVDVASSASIEQAWNTIQNEIGSIDKVIYCAGYYKPMSADNMQIEEIEQMIQVNLTGCMRVLSCVVPEFITKRAGHVVLIGSIAGFRRLPNAIGYGASKAGIIHLAENLKCDLSEYNIKVQVINPGFVRTRLTDLNQFPMPAIMESEQAAKYIIKYMNSKAFEARFPFLFANLLKILSLLPYWLYFKIMKLIK
jgi:short-subunit dehydrogenase